jgi:hypothetical protein
MEQARKLEAALRSRGSICWCCRADREKLYIEFWKVDGPDVLKDLGKIPCLK